MTLERTHTSVLLFLSGGFFGIGNSNSTDSGNSTDVAEAIGCAVLALAGNLAGSALQQTLNGLLVDQNISMALEDVVSVDIKQLQAPVFVGCKFSAGLDVDVKLAPLNQNTTIPTISVVSKLEGDFKLSKFVEEKKICVNGLEFNTVGLLSNLPNIPAEFKEDLVKIETQLQTQVKEILADIQC